MQYRIQSTKPIPLKSGKVKYEVVTDQGMFQTWDQSIGTAAPGTVFEALCEDSRWQGRNGQWNTDRMLKLAGPISAPQGGGGAAAAQGGSAKPSLLSLAAHAVQCAIIADPKANEKDLTHMAVAYAKIIKAVEKELATPDWLRALKASGLVKEVKDVGFVASDMETMWGSVSGEAEKFIAGVKAAVAAKKQTPPPAANEEDDLPF